MSLQANNNSEEKPKKPKLKIIRKKNISKTPTFRELKGGKRKSFEFGENLSKKLEIFDEAKVQEYKMKDDNSNQVEISQPRKNFKIIRINSNSKKMDKKENKNENRMPKKENNLKRNIGCIEQKTLEEILELKSDKKKKKKKKKNWPFISFSSPPTNDYQNREKQMQQKRKERLGRFTYWFSEESDDSSSSSASTLNSDSKCELDTAKSQNLNSFQHKNNSHTDNNCYPAYQSPDYLSLKNTSIILSSTQNSSDKTNESDELNLSLDSNLSDVPGKKKKRKNSKSSKGDFKVSVEEAYPVNFEQIEGKVSNPNLNPIRQHQVKFKFETDIDSNNFIINKVYKNSDRWFIQSQNNNQDSPQSPFSSKKNKNSCSYSNSSINSNFVSPSRSSLSTNKNKKLNNEFSYSPKPKNEYTQFKLDYLSKLTPKNSKSDIFDEGKHKCVL